MYSKILNSQPVNKSASLVTSQSGCSDTFLLNAKEQLEILGKSKRHYADLMFSLKEKMGIDGRLGVRHPDYKIYTGLKQKLRELDLEINDVHKKIKSLSPEQKAETFERLFVNTVKEKYPHIFGEIKTIILKKMDII